MLTALSDEIEEAESKGSSGGMMRNGPIPRNMRTGYGMER